MKYPSFFAEIAGTRLAQLFIIGILLLAKICGRIVGSFARTQTRLLTQAQALGWKPSDFEAAKLIRRQHQLFNFIMAKKRMRRLRDSEAQNTEPRTQ